MLSVQCPLQLVMTNDNLHDHGHSSWNAWRAPSNLPTPPSSVPPRRLASSKQCYPVGLEGQRHLGIENEVIGSFQHNNLTLPPIAHLDRHWPSSSPLTPPDDEIRSSSISLSGWRDAKPGPSRDHSPMTANHSPLLASPSPSPIDEDERYDEAYDAMEEQPGDYDDSMDQEWSQDGCRRDVGDELAHEQLDVSEDGQASPSQAADWVTTISQRSAHFIAEKTCEMVCYLWFSSSLGPRAAAASRARRERERSRRRARDGSLHHGVPHSPPLVSRPLSNASTATLQFCASPEFIAFMAKLLSTTQVSQSVIVLSLHYIYRLKERNDFTLGKPGSEFRAAVCALMLANKFVDDNTYTNKTWSDVSAIPLEELNKMEREFLLGVGFHLFVDAQTYDSWLNLLKGLVIAKEREFTRWQARKRARVVVPRIKVPNFDNIVPRVETQRHQRARSTSPRRSRNYAYAPAYPFTFAIPSSSSSHLQPQTYTQSQSTQTSPDRPVSKRTAADAFSPTSATFAGAARGGKRPTGLALDIGAALASASSSTLRAKDWERAGSVSAQPACTYTDSLRGLEKMSLATPGDQQPRVGMTDESIAKEREEQTLAAPYRGADAARRPLPPHLYFYALASSPLRSPYSASSSEQAQAETSHTYSHADAPPSETSAPPGAERKTRLRYVDSQADDGYGYWNNAYSYPATHIQTSNQTASGACYQQSAYPAGGSAATYRSASGSAYTQPQVRHQPVVAEQSQAQTQYTHGHHQIQHSQRLPSLALALSMPTEGMHASAGSTNGVHTSPLPGFATLEAYAPPVSSSTHSHIQSNLQNRSHPPVHQSYTAPHAYSLSTGAGVSSTYAYSSAPQPAPAAQSSWSAPPSETVDGVYVPPLRHVVSPHHQHHLPAPMPYRTYAPSSYVYAPQQPDTVATGSTYASQPQYPSLAERATFANAGPAGIIHLYQYARSGSTLGTSDCGYTSGGNSSSSAAPATSGMVHQSQSVNTSPNALYVYDYDSATRGRHL